MRDESLADEALKRSIAKESPNVETKPHVVFNTKRSQAILDKREADKQAAENRMAEYAKRDRELNPYGRGNSGYVQAVQEGNFVRTREHAFADQLRYEQNLKAQAERAEQQRLAEIRARQAERDAVEARRLQEAAKDSKQYFLEYHSNRRDAGARSQAVVKYCLSREYRQDEQGVRLALKEIHDPEFMKLYAPERFHATQMTGLPKCSVCETYIQDEKCLCT
jgi:hypothetical protein